MRLWSLHPKYLDVKGIVALWREGLLAKHVLEGRTKGYTNHPQLARFKACQDPVAAIHQYLAVVCIEAESRGYHFDRSKISWNVTPQTLSVTRGQLQYEVAHLYAKLTTRDPVRAQALQACKRIASHPMFQLVKGPMESWERIS